MKHLFAAVAAACLAASAWAANPVVELKTSEGPIRLELYPDKAPESVKNFLAYVKSGHYDGTIFHRVIRGFMIQGGGFDQDMKQRDTQAPVRNEAKNGLKNKTGSIAMARTSAPHSATAQFFINLVDNTSLDYPSPDGWGYAVFGEVTDGLDVVKKIGDVRTAAVGYYRDVPVAPIVIESATVVEAPPAN